MTCEDFNNCPIGVKNEQKIVHTQEKFDMALQRMEEKLDDLKEDVTAGFSDVNNRLEKLDKQVSKLENNLPSKIDERLATQKGKVATDIWKWILTGVGGSILITIITNWVIK